ncbi:MAG: cupin domain-containing protein [Anaerolineaceae bacterium]|nr:cupin domain-containing protein [Anaerolineaceae bacterium]
MPTNQSLGEQIRNHRRTQKLTLVQMADGCNISPSFLSQIERGQANPSVTTLYAISDMLGVTTASFFTESDQDNHIEEVSFENQTTAKVVRAKRRKTLIYPGTNILNELLTPDLQGAIQMMWIVMPPGTDSGTEPFVHQGEECGVILQGELETWIGGEKYILGPGDSIYHSSEIPHRSKNIGDTDVIMVVAKTPPSI